VYDISLTQKEIRMDYFVTGATGFIGKRLVRKLLARPGSTVHFLTRRPESSGLSMPSGGRGPAARSQSSATSG
jgi:uncharacterized protein YbjT (DUF2867 family)